MQVFPAQSDTPLKHSGSRNEGLYYVSQERPLFSRPSSSELKLRSGDPFSVSFQVQASETYPTDTPKYAAPSGIISQRKEQYSSRSNGW